MFYENSFKRILTVLSVLCIFIVMQAYIQSRLTKHLVYTCHNEKNIMTTVDHDTLDTVTATEHTLVLYAYFESKERKINLQFFLDFAVNRGKTDLNIDYVIIVNGYTCTVDIPTQKNIHVIRRENTGFDSCAWKHALDKMMKEKGEQWYKYIFFINASVRGPFLPVYTTDHHWTSLFTKYLSEDIKLVGTSIYCPSPRFPNYNVTLQSMFLVTDAEGLKIVEPLLQCFKDKQSVIHNIELKLTQAFIEKGYNVASMLKRWEGHDFQNKKKTIEMCQHDIKGKPHGDPYYRNLYFSNISISPFEVIFFKTNRNVDNDLIEAYTQMMYEKIKYK